MKKDKEMASFIENAALGNDRDLVNQLLGQVQATDAIAKLTSTVAVSKMAYIKENKLYKGLAGMKNLDGRGLNGTWEEFCKLLNTSVAKVNEDIGNLQAFGEEALESMSRMGIGYREMRKYRRLPDDQRNALLEVAESGDKDKFVEAAEDFVSQNEKEKAVIAKERDDAKADYTAQSELMKKKAAELDETKLELEKARRHLQGLSVDAKVKEVREELGLITFEIEALMMGRFREGVEILFNEEPDKHTLFLSAQLKQIEMQLIALRDEFGIPENITHGDELDWLKDGQEEQFDFVNGEFQSHSGSTGEEA